MGSYLEHESFPRQEPPTPREVFRSVGLDHQELHKTKNRIPKILGGLAIGLSTLYIGGDIAWNQFNQSGERVYFPSRCSSSPHGDSLKVMTWNMKKMEANQKRKLNVLVNTIENKQTDIAAVQEVTYPAAKAIFRRLRSKCFSMVYVIADTVQHNGNLGDAIITRQRPEDFKVESLPGTSYNDTLGRWTTGLWHAITHIDDKDAWNQFNAAWQERRVAEEVTIKARVNGRLENITDINTHITSSEDDGSLHSDQFEKVMQLANSNTNTNTSVIITGDFNSWRKAVDPVFKKSGYIPFITGPTGSSAGRANDRIAYRNNGNQTLSGGYAYIQKEENVSDHDAVIAIISLGDYSTTQTASSINNDRAGASS